MRFFSRDIAIYYLGHSSDTLITHEIECLCFDIGMIQRFPFEIVYRQFRIGGCLVRYRLYCRRSIFGLFRSGNMRQAGCWVSMEDRSMLGMETDFCLSQFILYAPKDAENRVVRCSREKEHAVGFNVSNGRHSRCGLC